MQNILQQSTKKHAPCCIIDYGYEVYGAKNFSRGQHGGTVARVDVLLLQGTD